jgi:hypothetical protein
VDELREEFVKTILTFIDIGQLQVEEGKGDLLILAGELEGARVLLERLEQSYPSKKRTKSCLEPRNDIFRIAGIQSRALRRSLAPLSPDIDMLFYSTHPIDFQR